LYVIVKRRKLTNVVSLEANSNSFLTLRPEWTLTGATLACGTRGEFTLEQRPFRWLEGVWEAEVVVTPTDADKVPHHLRLRIDSETVRRWKDIGINPFLEACAQIREHLCGARGGGTASYLVLL
jgi:hypothetical protein